jgi:hypothetical protein
MAWNRAPKVVIYNPLFWFALILALVIDVTDYLFLIGYGIPPLLWAIDIVGSGILYFFMGPLAIVGLVDLVPIIGFIPTFSILVLVHFIGMPGSSRKSTRKLSSKKRGK